MGRRTLGRARRGPARSGRLRRRRRGVLELPLQLTIIVLVLGIMVPILVSSIAVGSEQAARAEMVIAIDDLVSAAGQAYSGDNNTTIVVSVTLPTGGEITLGGPLLSPTCHAPVGESAYLIQGKTPGYPLAPAETLDGFPRTPLGSVPMTSWTTSVCTTYPLVLPHSGAVAFEHLWVSEPGAPAIPYDLVAVAL